MIAATVLVSVLAVVLVVSVEVRRYWCGRSAVKDLRRLADRKPRRWDPTQSSSPVGGSPGVRG